MIDDLYSALKKLPQVDALALGGSRAGGRNDKSSDYDLYVYLTSPLDIESRRSAIVPLCQKAEIGNHYFEEEDNIILADGVYVDIIYRFIGMFDEMITAVIEGKCVRNGYSTCFWHNIKTSQVIFDKSGEYTRLREKAQCDYPPKLKAAIIERNMALLTGNLPSYDKQISKAYYRHDYVSVNHRVAAFLESYFDVIFALNEMTHPGEKKLIQICEAECKILPANFKDNLMKLFEYMFKYDVSDILENMVAELKKVIYK